MTWQLTKLSEFLSEREGRIRHEQANTLGLQRIKKIDFSGHIHLDSETDTKTDMIRVCDGDLVISGINAAKGAISVYVGNEDVLATIHYSAYEFNPDRISVEFLKWFFKSPEFSQLLKEQVAGGIKTELKAKQILPLQIRLPPLSEQIQIAERLNAYQSKKLKIESEVSRQHAYVSSLRESLLNEALQGKLTSQWREENPDCEPASVILDEIQNKKFAFISQKGERTEVILPAIDPSEVPFKIPETWQWCRLGSLIQSKPRNGLSIKPVDYKTVTKTLKLSATSSGVFDETQYKYLNIIVEEDSHLWLKDGDILIQRANSLELVGTAAIYRGNERAYIYPDLIMKCRCVFDEHTEFVHAVLQAKFSKDYYRRNSTGAAGNMPKINQNTVMNTLIPFPPDSEQIAIMEKVASLMASIEALERVIADSRKHLAALDDAVLQEVFTQTTP